MDTSLASGDYTKVYTLDLVGNRTKLVETKEGQPPAETAYTYTSRDQLVTESRGSVTTYGYDSSGSLIVRQGGGEDATYAWDARGRMVGATVTRGGPPRLPNTRTPRTASAAG